MLDASIPLQVKVPEQPNLIDQYARLQQVRDSQSQAGLRQVQTAEASQRLSDSQVAAAQQQRKIQSQEKMRQAFVTANGDPAKTIQAAIANGADSDEIQNAQLHFADLQKKTADATKVDLENNGARNTQTLSLVDSASAMQAQNPQGYAQSWPQIYAHALQIDPKAKDILNPNTPATPQELATMRAASAMQGYFIAGETEKRAADKAASDLKATAANTAKVLAETPGVGADSDIKVAQAAAMKSQKAEDWDSVIDKVSPPTGGKPGAPDANASTKALVRSAMAAGATPTEIQKIVQDSSKKVQSDRASMDLMLKEQPFKLQQSVSQAVATARAMQGSGPTAGVPPALQSKATDQYEKSGMTYANALSASDEMKTFIDLARSGNKVAYAYAPTTGVLTINSANGTKRVNMSEISQYSGAGSAWDKAQQWFGKNTTGESIDPSILSAMEQTHAALADVAGRKHAMEVNAINQATGAKFQPMRLGGRVGTSGAKAAQGGYEVGVKYSGKQYLGGDPHDAANWK